MNGTNTWICSNDSNHVYDENEAIKTGYFCPKCPYGEGILMQSTVSTSSSQSPNQHQDDLGLCIILLDCSGSMNDPCFPGNPIRKKQLIAKSASAGIFSLSGNSLKEFAYILILGFDHRVITLLPFTNVKDIVEQHKDGSELENVLLEKMEQLNGATNINEALKVAAKFTQQFINSDIDSLGNYKPRIQTVLDDNMTSHQVPNVRTLLFSDGEHYVGSNDTKLLPSPFKELPGTSFDLLMSAYYGNEGDKGYHQLKSLVSKCPVHNSEDQFFLFDEPTKVPSLKGLFRMASGSSGFCPKCLEEATIVTGDSR